MIGDIRRLLRKIYTNLILRASATSAQRPCAGTHRGRLVRHDELLAVVLVISAQLPQQAIHRGMLQQCLATDLDYCAGSTQTDTQSYHELTQGLCIVGGEVPVRT